MYGLSMSLFDKHLFCTCNNNIVGNKTRLFFQHRVDIIHNGHSSFANLYFLFVSICDPIIRAHKLVFRVFITKNEHCGSLSPQYIRLSVLYLKQNTRFPDQFILSSVSFHYYYLEGFPFQVCQLLSLHSLYTLHVSHFVQVANRSGWNWNRKMCLKPHQCNYTSNEDRFIEATLHIFPVSFTRTIANFHFNKRALHRNRIHFLRRSIHGLV